MASVSAEPSRRSLGGVPTKATTREASRARFPAGSTRAPQFLVSFACLVVQDARNLVAILAGWPLQHGADGEARPVTHLLVDSRDMLSDEPDAGHDPTDQGE